MVIPLYINPTYLRLLTKSFFTCLIYIRFDIVYLRLTRQGLTRLRKDDLVVLKLTPDLEFAEDYMRDNEGGLGVVIGKVTSKELLTKFKTQYYVENILGVKTRFPRRNLEKIGQL